MTDRDSGNVTLPDGRVLRWLASGPPDGPLLLWLHGSTGSRRTAPCSVDARVVAYDRPGFGDSGAYLERDLRSDAEDICGLLDALLIERVPVLAFSGGAAGGYALAAYAPDRIKTLNIVSGATWPTDDAPPIAVLEAAGERLYADPGGVVDGLLVDAPVTDLCALRDPAIYEQLVLGAHDAVAQGPQGWVTEARVVRSAWGFGAADVRCPTRLWHGCLDTAVPLDAALRTADTLPDATLQEMPESGHFGWLTVQHAIVAAAVSGDSPPTSSDFRPRRD